MARDKKIANRHPDSKKVEVATHYLTYGNMKETQRVTGVPYTTIRLWRKSAWWQEVEAEIRLDENAALDSKLSRLVEHSLTTVANRLEHGDFVLDSRTGEVRRIPVKMRDATRVAKDMLDQRNLVRGNPTSRVETIGVADIMKKLAEEFKKWAKLINKPNDEIVIEGEIIDAIYDEREERLQERESPVLIEAGPSEQPGSPEQSPCADGTTSGTQHQWGRGSQDANKQGWEQRQEQPTSNERSEESLFLPQQ